MSASTYVSPYWAQKLGIEENKLSDNTSFASSFPIIASLGLQKDLLNSSDIKKAGPFMVATLSVALGLIILI